MVYCTSCKRWLPRSDFDCLLRDPSKRRKKCRCCVEVEKDYLRRNRARKQAYDKQHGGIETEEQKDARNTRRRARYATDGGQRRRYENMRRRGVDRQGETQRRRAKIKGAEGSISEVEWFDIKRQHDFRCAYCGKRKKLTMDHVVPLARGGRHDKTNIVPACVNCNSQKHTADWSERLRRAG